MRTKLQILSTLSCVVLFNFVLYVLLLSTCASCISHRFLLSQSSIASSVSCPGGGTASQGLQVLHLHAKLPGPSLGVLVGRI